MSVSIFQRGGRWSVRVSFPEDRWGDIGRATGAAKGIKRDVCRTLETSSRREAEDRKLEAAAAIRREVDGALVQAKLRPLTDWTADWMDRAVQHREDMRLRGADIIPQSPDEHGRAQDDRVGDLIWERVEAEEEEVRRRRGDEAARRFREVAGGKGMTVAQAARVWLAEERGKVREGTIASHEAALKRLGAFLSRTEGWPSLEGVALSAVTRRMAGDLLAERRASAAWETTMRDFSAYSGLWRWALRRGHAEVSPWPDQTAGMKSRRAHDSAREAKRGYTSAELVKLLRAGPTDLAPARGGYAATFWDLIRLSLLTGARASETLNLRVRDVLEDGTAVALAAEGGKTDSASRIVPLHPLAARVVADRLAALPDRSLPHPSGPRCRRRVVTNADQRSSATAIRSSGGASWARMTAPTSTRCAGPF